jgi:RNA polymerase sigma-B factor
MAPELLQVGASTQVDRRSNELRSLLSRCSAGDPRAREAVVVELLPYARFLARKFIGRGEPLEDLYQAASLGLIKAVDAYDPEKGSSFVRYAEFRILGEIRNHFRAVTQRVHLPRSLQDRARSVARAREELRASLGAEPTTEAVAELLKLSPAQVGEADEALRAGRPKSLDATVAGKEDEDGNSAEWIGQPDPGYERVEDALWCRDALRRLSPRERDVVVLRYGGELTQTDIARRVGVSQMHVSRLLRTALASLTAVAGVS